VTRRKRVGKKGPLPAGEYTVRIARMVPVSRGRTLRVTLQVLKGPYKGRRMNEHLGAAVVNDKRLRRRASK